MKSFLLVDDDRSITDTYELLIKSRHDDVHVVHALNGGEGLEEVRKQNFSVIISDIAMPVMNGIEFHKRLKEENPLMSKRVVFISGYFHKLHVSYILEENCPCLEKPFKSQDFYKLLDYLL